MNSTTLLLALPARTFASGIAALYDLFACSLREIEMGRRLTPDVIAQAKSYVEERFGVKIPWHAVHLAAAQAEHLIEYFIKRKVTKVEDVVSNPHITVWKHAAMQAHLVYDAMETEKATV